MKEQTVRLFRRLAQTTGLMPYEVPFDTLVQEPSQFHNKWIKTAGVYYPVSRSVISQVEWIAGPSMLPDTRVERHVVAEQGIMTDTRQRRAVRVYRAFNFGSRQEMAQQAALDLPEHQWIPLDGRIREGFPGEYFLRTGLLDGMSA